MKVDRLAFFRMGGTLFGNPEALTLKEIHLDTGSLSGREVIVEGQIDEVSRHGTYLVLKDDLARLLIVLTDMDTAAPLLREKTTKALKVLGTVEAGTKGLPFIKARSLNFPDDGATVAGAESSRLPPKS